MDHVPAAEAVIDFELDQDSVELLDTDVTPEELDRDPEPDSATPGFSLQPHRNGGYAVLIHGEFHKRFAGYEAARRYLAEAEADWAGMFDPNRGNSFTGHPAQEGGE